MKRFDGYRWYCGLVLAALTAACGDGGEPATAATSNGSTTDTTAPSVSTADTNTTPAPAGAATGTTTTTATTGTTGTSTATSATANWVECATEGSTCSFSGTREVRYGTATQNLTKTFTDTVSCTNSVFGDPLEGTRKTCWYADQTTTAQASTTTTTAPLASPTTTPTTTAATSSTGAAATPVAPLPSTQASSDANAPKIFNASSSAKAGDVISLQGANLGSAEVWLQGAAGAADTKLEVLNRVGDIWLTAVVPQNAQGALLAKVTSSAGTSGSIKLNAAVPYHLDTLQLMPGAPFRIFGRNLLVSGATPVVKVDGAAASVNASLSDEHMLVVTAPSPLQASTDAVITVDNGNGTGASQLDRKIDIAVDGSADPFALKVGWGGAFANLATRTFNASSDARLANKAVCNAQQDDTAAVQSAIDLAAANAGGVVQLPAGTCRIAGVVNLKSKVVLQGAGKGVTTLRYEANYPLFGKNLDLVGVRNLTLVNAGSAQQGPLLENNTRVFLQNVRVDIGISHQMFLTNNKNMVVTGSDFVQQRGLDMQGPYVFNGTGGLAFTGNTISWAQGAPTYMRVHDSYIQGNRFTRDSSDQNVSGTVHSLVIDFAHRIAVAGNTFDVSGGPVTNKVRNDGETVLTEGGGSTIRTENLGTVASASATSLSDPNNSLRVDPFATGSIPENYGVAIVGGKGAGQTRRVTAYNAGTMTVDRAWSVVPDSSSKYSTFVWGLEKSLIKDNTLSQNPRGIWLYQTAIRDVDVLNNNISEGGGIFLRSFQDLAAKHFDPIYNIKIAKNKISNTTGNWASHINAVFINKDAKAFGIGFIGVEVRDNQVIANVQNVTTPNEDYATTEGYMNMMRVETYSMYETTSTPRLLGTIFHRNACTNCDVALRLGTGAVGSVLSGTQLVNSKVLWTDTKTTISPELSINTLVQ